MLNDLTEADILSLSKEGDNEALTFIITRYRAKALLLAPTATPASTILYKRHCVRSADEKIFLRDMSFRLKRLLPLAATLR